MKVVALFALVLLTGCVTALKAPVVERNASLPPPAALPAPAPGAATAANRPETYTVKRGDTLYSIALDNGLNYRELAEWNGLSDPAVMRAGQVLRMRPPEPASADSGVQVQPITGNAPLELRPLDSRPLDSRPLDSRPLDSRPPDSRPTDAKPAESSAAARPGVSVVKNEPKALKLPYSEDNLAALKRQDLPAPTAQAKPEPRADAKPETKADPGASKPTPSKPEAPTSQSSAQSSGADEDRLEWGWPTAGRVVTGFSESTNKGLDIGGKTGQPVFASAAGQVLYVGNAIRGYGKLLVIRHNKAYSSVYAHNSEILVKEGQSVAKGQKVAEMGNSDSDRVKLHFEIRHQGKPVDPAKLLPDRPA